MINLATAGAIVLALEGTARLGELDPKYRHSPTRGYELVPGHGSEKEHVNAHGLRGPEIGAKAPGAFRVLAMGGSTTFGSGLRDDETWPHLLERELRGRGLDHVEVLNGGVSGYGLEQIVVALDEHHLDALEPDLVLVYSGWNYPEIAGNPTIVKYRAKRTFDLGSHSGWALDSAFMRRLRELLRDDVEVEAREKVARQDAARAEQARVMAAAFPGLCRRLAEVCARRGVEVAVVRYPGLVQVPVDAEGDGMRLLLERLGHDKERFEVKHDDVILAEARAMYASAIDVVERAAAQSGLRLLDVAGRMQSAVLRGAGPGDFRPWVGCFIDFMHLTPVGNAALADAFADALLERGLLEQPSADAGVASRR